MANKKKTGVVSILGVFITLVIILLNVLRGPVGPDNQPVVKTQNFISGYQSFYKGMTRERILEKNPNLRVGPRVKPGNCMWQWVDVSNMTESEEFCLKRAKVWLLDDIDSDFCPAGSNHFVTLSFEDLRVKKIDVHCTSPS